MLKRLLSLSFLTIFTSCAPPVETCNPERQICKIEGSLPQLSKKAPYISVFINFNPSHSSVFSVKVNNNLAMDQCSGSSKEFLIKGNLYQAGSVYSPKIGQIEFDIHGELQIENDLKAIQVEVIDCDHEESVYISTHQKVEFEEKQTDLETHVLHGEVYFNQN